MADGICGKRGLVSVAQFLPKVRLLILPAVVYQVFPSTFNVVQKTNVDLVLVHDDKMAMLVGLAAEVRYFVPPVLSTTDFLLLDSVQRRTR